MGFCHVAVGYLLIGLLTRLVGGRLFFGLQGPGFRREYGWLLVAFWWAWWGLLACFLAHEAIAAMADDGGEVV